MAHSIPTLSALEARALGTLIEKQHTVPDAYPLTLNALVAGCNQKTSRSPIMDATQAQVQVALDGLKSAHLAIETSGGRVARYSHNIERVLQLSAPSVALLTSLMLRGPQTPGELRINCERLHGFSDLSAVESVLRELAARSAGALTMELPRLLGARENRWAHLLSGEPKTEMAATQSETNGEVSLAEIAALKANMTRLDAELASVRALLMRICAELGIKP